MSPWLRILLVISSTLQISVCQRAKKGPNTSVCNTQSCRDVAGAYTLSMDKTKDPCTDFYRYACGKWASNNPKPKYLKGDWSAMGQVSQLVETRMRDELQSRAAFPDSLAVTKLKKFYKTCMDESAIRRDTMPQALRVLTGTGEFPMIMGANQWNADRSSWQTVDDYYSTLLGNSTFYSMKLEGGYWAVYYRLLIEAPRFYQDVYGTRQNYKSLIKGVAQALIQENKANIPTTQLDKDINDLVNFEDKLYEAYRYSNTTKKIENLPNFVTEWNRILKDYADTRVDWNQVFQRLYDFTNVRPSISASVTLKPYDYFTRLPAILKSTSKRTIINFIQWKLLSKILPHTTTSMEDLFYKTENNVNDVSNKPPRWVHCVHQIGRNYGGYSLFIKKFFPLPHSQNTKNLYDKIIAALTKKLQDSNWLTPLSKQETIREINAIVATLGYSRFYANDMKVNEYFGDMVIGDSYFRNTLNFMEQTWKAQIKYWGSRFDSKEKLEDIFQLHAAYHQRIAAISVRAGFFQTPLLSGALPKYVPYGTVGSIIGHEIGHHLDYEYFKVALSRPEVSKFATIVQCFINIYENYFRTARLTYGATISNPQKRALDTQKENIADWIGVNVAYQAYTTIRNSEMPNGEDKLPGFEGLTDNQMFFISYAQSWCHSNFDDRETGVHSPAFLRAFVPLTQMPQFATAFHCSGSVPMNPPHKCNWFIKENQ